MRHVTARVETALPAGLAGAGIWVTNAFAYLTPYVGGYIIGSQITYACNGLLNTAPCKFSYGYGPVGGPGIQLGVFRPRTMYTAAGVLVITDQDTLSEVDLRCGGIAGGVEIVAANVYTFGRNDDAGAVAANLTIELTLTILLP